MQELRRLRLRLTAWTVGVFGFLLLLFGVALFLVATRQVSARLDGSIARAMDVLQRTVGDEAARGWLAAGHASDLGELRIPDRTLYVFAADGTLVYPDSAGAWVRGLASRALGEGEVRARHEFPDEVSWRALARRYATAGRGVFALVVTADAVELDDAYAGLVLRFSLAAIVALAAVGLGGWFVTGRMAEPIRDAFQRLRDFTANAAHELRTPVAVIEGHADVVLRQPRQAAEYVATLGTIRSEAVRLGGMLENLLIMARADAGAWPIRKELLYLDDVVLDVAQNAQVLGADRGVTVDVEALDELPVHGDPELLRQLVMILLDNAIRFSPDAQRVLVAVRRQGGRADLVVTDHGPGMEPEVVARVFDRFYSGDASRTRGSGAGLGLAIARWIADLHDAVIAIDSQPGQGTRVSVRFSLKEES